MNGQTANPCLGTNVDIPSHGFDYDRVDFKERILHWLPRDARTLYDDIQRVTIFTFGVDVPVVPIYPPCHRSKLLKRFREGRCLPVPDSAFIAGEEGKTAGLRRRGYLAGIKGKGIGGTIAPGYRLAKSNDSPG